MPMDFGFTTCNKNGLSFAEQAANTLFPNIWAISRTSTLSFLAHSKIRDSNSREIASLSSSKKNHYCLHVFKNITWEISLHCLDKIFEHLNNDTITYKTHHKSTQSDLGKSLKNRNSLGIWLGGLNRQIFNQWYNHVEGIFHLLITIRSIRGSWSHYPNVKQHKLAHQDWNTYKIYQRLMHTLGKLVPFALIQLGSLPSLINNTQESRPLTKKRGSSETKEGCSWSLFISCCSSSLPWKAKGFNQILCLNS